jgi:hypothetical protein
MNVFEPKLAAAGGIDGTWCMRTSCRTCHCDWWICTSCEVSLANKKRLNKHIIDRHSLHPVYVGATRDFEFDDDRSSGATLATYEQCDTAINMVECAISAVFLQSTYGREESVNYYEMEHYGEMLGVNSLIEIAVMLHESQSRSHLEANPLPIVQVDIQFQLAKLHLSLPKALSAELAFVCDKIMDKTREEFKALDKRQYNPKCIIPTSVVQLTRLILVARAPSLIIFHALWRYNLTTITPIVLSPRS